MSRYWLAFILIASSAGGVAAATDDEAVPREAISYAGLRLDTSEGVHELDRRIAGALLRVCGRSFSGSVVETRRSRSCRIRNGKEIDRQRSLAIARAARPQRTQVAAAPGR